MTTPSSPNSNRRSAAMHDVVYQPNVPTHNGHVHAALLPAIEPIDIPSELIAVRAHERFVARGAVHGHDHEDWAAAERELVEAQQAARAKAR